MANLLYSSWVNLFRILFVGALLSAPVMPGYAQNAPADGVVQAARARYEAGEVNFKIGKYLEAAVEFEAAYKLTPRPDLLYDAAQAYDRGGDEPRAVEFYESYLRTGEGLPEEAAVKQRLGELSQKVARITVTANKDGAHVYIDGRERGVTPMVHPVPVGSGIHKVEVRLGDMVWRIEQEFVKGLSSTLQADLQPPAPIEESERRNKRFVAVLGLGGVLDIKSANFPPSQAAMLFGFEYRVHEAKNVAVDVGLRIPVQVGQGWTNTAILPNIRLVLELSRKVPLELVPALDLGISILHRSGPDAPPANPKVPPCGGAPVCTLPALRIHPSLNFVYHFLPNWEARVELFGLDVDISSPILDPRVTFGLSAAWRFY